MRSSKKVVALLAGAALAVVGVVGCGDSKPAEETEEVEVVEETDGGEVEEEVVEEVPDEADEAEAAAEVAGDFMSEFLTLTVGADKEVEAALEDPEDDVEGFYDSLKISKYISLDGMDEEEAYEFKEQFYYLAIMGMLKPEGDVAKVVFTVPADAVTIDGDAAVADISKGTGTAEIDGEEVEGSGEGFPLDIKMVLDGGEWKIDGLDFMKTAKTLTEDAD